MITKLCDCSGNGAELEIEFEHFQDGSIGVKPKGYGDYSSISDGCPLIIELHQGRLRLLTWPDINDQNAQIMDFDGARLEKREPDEYSSISPVPGDGVPG